MDSNVVPSFHQKRYLLFCEIYDLVPGEAPYDVFLEWVLARLRAFKRGEGLGKNEYLSAAQQKAFDLYLESFGAFVEVESV